MFRSGYTWLLKGVALVPYVGLAVIQAAQDQPTDALKTRDYRDYHRAFAVVETRVWTEVDGFREHNWAGEYIRHYGLGYDQLVVAPTAGFVFTSFGCELPPESGAHPGSKGYGQGTFRDGRLLLKIDRSLVRGFHSRDDMELIPIRWGARRYLVPKEDLIEFCNRVNAGNEPESRPPSVGFLHQGDASIPVFGWPELPVAFRSYLLREPIRGTLIGGGKQLPDDPSWPGWPRYSVILNVGA